MRYLKNYTGSIYARSPFASGCLTEKLNFKSKFNKKDYRYDWLRNSRLASIIKQIEEIKKIYNGDIKKLAIVYLLKNKKIKKTIIGIKRKEHLDFLNNLDCKIDPNLLKKIDVLNEVGFYMSDKEIGY